MVRTRHVLIGTVSALALAALPVNLQSLLSGCSLEPAAALAKSDHSGGNGNGGGHGGGNGGGHGHSGEHGKSGATGGSGPSVGGSTHPGGPKLITGEETHGAKGKKATVTKVAKSPGKSAKKKTDEIETAALPQDEPLVGPKEKNFKARLAGLNSLNRNFRAYLNSQDPRMAGIRDYVVASARLDIVVDDADLVAYDGSHVYDGHPTLGELQDRLDALDDNPVAPGDPQYAAWSAEKAALEDVLDTPEAMTLQKAEDDAASLGTDDPALKQALLDAANKNRVAQYGDGYINDHVMNWAKDLLGVGDAEGKIDEVRQTLETDQQ
jgi:hypothetical protein